MSVEKRSIVKSSLIRGGRVLESFAAFLFFYLIITLYGAAIPVGELHEKGEMYIYVQSNGIHTDICIPTETSEQDWKDFIPTKDYPESDGFEFITIGWGDKGFFLDTPTWAELKVSTALNAAFLPSSTAMHVKYSSEPKVNDTRKKVFINKTDYERMIKYIKSSFKKVNNGVEVIANRGYTKADNFYEANNSYHMLRTCNIWTNEVLKVGNVRTGIYALFPDGILSHLQ